MSSIGAIKNSMLWAAYGDALGFISELCDIKVLKYRTHGIDRVTKLIEWRRKLGGQYGVSIDLPEGIYSDDTQLRLAVCRSIKKDGNFDFETFSKIEVPVFLAYGLGVGKGTRCAGESLQKKSVQWNTNFFEGKANRYTDTGGNGAAMRIQPHVWAATDQASEEKLINEIMRDTIITHGHPVGWVGSVFHGLVLRYCLLKGECPGPDRWAEILYKTRKIAEVCREDTLLKDIWLPAWERSTGRNIEKEIDEAINSMTVDMNKIHREMQNDYLLMNVELGHQYASEQKYKDVVLAIDALNSSMRGSAIKTALLSSFIGHFFSKQPTKGLEICVNMLGSDTDTIATMSGALLGACNDIEPPQKVLDYEYIVNQAKYLYNVSCRQRETQFVYPDLLHWSVPQSLLDMIGLYNERVALSGLGYLNPEGEPIIQKAKGITYWQFYKTSFQQTILLKHRERLVTLSPQSMPANLNTIGERIDQDSTDIKGRGITNMNIVNTLPAEKPQRTQVELPFDRKRLDTNTDLIIKGGFDEADIGKQLLSYAEDEDGLEKAIAFAAIIVKAKRARMKKGKNI